MAGKRYLTNNRGQAIVETALILPVIVLLLFAIMEFGQIFNQYIVVTAAAREGARAAAVSDDAAAQLAIVNATTSISNSGLSVAIVYPEGGREQGKSVTVTVSKPIEVNTPMIKEIIDSVFAGRPPMLVGRSVMRVEQP
ncbi:MAG: TadE-like protein [Firmicutes bacterium]|nr:TadE-like protein [Bacillota bacterium]